MIDVLLKRPIGSSSGRWQAGIDVDFWIFRSCCSGDLALLCFSRYSLTNYLIVWLSVAMRCVFCRMSTKILSVSEMFVILHSDRKDGRAVECGGLENRWPARVRGFESLSFRWFSDRNWLNGQFFCIKDYTYQTLILLWTDAISAIRVYVDWFFFCSFYF